MSRLAPSAEAPVNDPPARLRTRVRMAETGYLVLRVGTGLLFLCDGLQKLFGLFGGQAVPLSSRMGFAGVLELVGLLIFVFLALVPQRD